MKGRKRAAAILGELSGLGFMGTAGLHATGLGPVAALAEQGPEDLHSLVPALWLAFSSDLALVGLVVLAASGRCSSTNRLVLFVSGFVPAQAALLQVILIGFVAPTALLIALAGTTWASCGLMLRDPGLLRSPQTGA